MGGAWEFFRGAAAGPKPCNSLFVGQCVALRFLDGSVNNLTTQLISCTQCILYQSKYLLLAVSEVIHFKSLMLF